MGHRKSGLKRKRTLHNNKGDDQQEGITLVNNYAPNIGAPKYVKQIMMDIKGEVDRNTVIAGGSNTPLTSVDGSSRQKIKKGDSGFKLHIRSNGFN